MKLRYDDPDATSRKRQVYLAYIDHGSADALKVASQLGIKRNSCKSWISEFKRRLADTKVWARDHV
jgi:hypothetical protein